MEGDLLKFPLPGMNIEPGDYKDLIAADSRSSNEGSRPSWSSEFSTGSTLLSHALVDKIEESQAEVCAYLQDIESELRNSQISDQAGLYELENGTSCHASTLQDALPVCDEEKANNGPAIDECEFLNVDFNSPLQVTLLFRSFAETIPTPKFSESKKGNIYHRNMVLSKGKTYTFLVKNYHNIAKADQHKDLIVEEMHEIGHAGTSATDQSDTIEPKNRSIDHVDCID